jgi:hypothetical protein
MLIGISRGAAAIEYHLRAAIKKKPLRHGAQGLLL